MNFYQRLVEASYIPIVLFYTSSMETTENFVDLYQSYYVIAIIYQI